MDIVRELERELSIPGPEIVADYEESDEQLLESLREGEAKDGWLPFTMRWGFKPEALSDNEMVAHELECGMKDLVRQIRRARELLSD